MTLSRMTHVNDIGASSTPQWPRAFDSEKIHLSLHKKGIHNDMSPRLQTLQGGFGYRGGRGGRSGRGERRKSRGGGPISSAPPLLPPTHLPMLHPTWKLWWLHPPKCATSFRYVVMNYSWSHMRDTSWPFGNHQTLFPDISAARNTDNARLVAFFRHPEERLLSGYYHMQATPPCCTEDWGWSVAMARQARLHLHEVTSGSHPFKNTTIWLRGRFHGCQTNMLLGKGCMSEFAKTPAHVGQALEVLKDFVFIGDVGRWNLSICLFNRILTGRRFTLRSQLAQVRAGGKSFQLRSRADSEAASFRLARRAHWMPEDPIDGIIYRFVRLRLSRDLSRHHVRPECCPTFDTLEEAADATEVCA